MKILLKLAMLVLVCIPIWANEQFFNALSNGDEVTVKHILQKEPKLAKKVGSFGEAPVFKVLHYAKHTQQKHKVQALLNILNEHGADFNALRKSDKLISFDVTPLAYVALHAPLLDDLIFPLVVRKADYMHGSIDVVINYYQKNDPVVLDRGIWAKRPCFNLIKSYRKEKLIPPSYYENTLKINEKEFILGLAFWPSFLDKNIKSLQMWIKGHDHPVEFGSPETQKELFSLLIGKVSLKEALLDNEKFPFTIYFKYINQDDDKKIRLIDENLEQLIAREIGYN